MSKECLNQISSRRSIRRFSSEPIDERHINDIVKAGFSAPSAGNRQPWRVIIVTDQDVKNQLSNAAGGQTFIAKAPVIFVVCGVPEESAQRYKERGKTLYVLQDTAALTLNILHAAHMLGFGACWIGAFNEEEVSKILWIPSNMRPVSMIPVGKIEGNLPEMRPRRNLSEVIIQERFE
ncbi:MAG: nitroreductase family protein [Candidatus Thorarchaeota archaeon]|nr:MAG: nitroreductase family protein [Candidatus Thorarchaeota archaeon]